VAETKGFDKPKFMGVFAHLRPWFPHFLPLVGLAEACCHPLIRGITQPAHMARRGVLATGAPSSRQLGEVVPLHGIPDHATSNSLKASWSLQI
jgi:hypothetical protein